MPEMPVMLTFAELAFLLPDESDSVRDRLRLQRWELDSAVVLSGAASLFARGLLHVVEDDVLVPIEQVATVIAAISSPDNWVEVGFARDSETGGLQVYESGDVRVDIISQPFGTYAFALSRNAGSLAETIGAAVSVFLTEPSGGAAFVKRGDALAGTDTGLAVRRSPDGQIELASGHVEDAAIRAVTLDEALAEVRAFAA